MNQSQMSTNDLANMRIQDLEEVIHRLRRSEGDPGLWDTEVTAIEQAIKHIKATSTSAQQDTPKTAIKTAGPSSYYVPSKSGGEDHLVVLQDGQLSCDCKGYLYRRSCSHIIDVGALVAKEGSR